MNHTTVKSACYISFCLLIAGFGSSVAKSLVPFYPDSLFVELGIDEQDIANNQKRFYNDEIHVTWMNHVSEVLPEISLEKKETIISIHTSMLLIKDSLDTSFFSGKLQKQEYTAKLTRLMKYFQDANRSALNEKEYNLLFGFSDQDEQEPAALSNYGELGFPVNNPDTTIDMIQETFDAPTIKDISRFYYDQAREFRDIKKIYETENISGVEKKQIKQDMDRIEGELQTAFINYCRSRLSAEQFKLLFDSQINK